MDTQVVDQKPAWKRFLPLGVILAAIGVAWSQGWHQQLTLENIALNREALKTYIANNLVLSLLAYAAIYIAVVALSLPGATVLTLSGGLLFGWAIGGPVTVVAATIGATIIFLVAQSSFGESLAAKAGGSIDKLREGFKEDAFNYLLFLRLVPAFPFVLVNIAPALLGVNLRTFFLATLFGIIPGTMAYSFFGSGLDSVIEAQTGAYNTCVAANGADACTLKIDPSSLITPEIVYAFIALGVVALIPIAIKRFRKTA